MAGMLVLSRYEDCAFEDADITSLTAFGALAGMALRNAKLYEQATATTRRLQAAAQAATDVAAIGDLSALLQRIIRHACESAGADTGAVMRIEGTGGGRRCHIRCRPGQLSLAARGGDHDRHRGRPRHPGCHRR